MEDEKKKKRNKKKKNKQNKATDDAVCGGEATSADQNHVNNESFSQNGGIQNDEVEPQGYHQLNIAEAACAEEKIKQLQAEADAYLLKEAELEETIKHLRVENDTHFQKEAILEETVRLLKNDKHSYIHKEAELEETTIHLRNENDILVQNMTISEEKMRQLLDERSTLALKEATLEEKLRHLEQDKESWLATETGSKETISSLSDEISRLRVQVVELEESKSSLLEQNQQLRENVSDLQVQLREHERNMSSAHSSDELRKDASEQEDLKSQIDAACVLIERLISENAELVEKVNGLCIKLNQQTLSSGLSSTNGNVYSLPGTAETMRIADPVILSTETIPIGVQTRESLEEIPIDDELIHSYDNTEKEGATAVDRDSLEAESTEIMRVTFDADEDGDVETHGVEKDDEDDVPLMDAPLIGAPFRLVSFVARYVSGADLVEK